MPGGGGGGGGGGDALLPGSLKPERATKQHCFGRAMYTCTRLLAARHALDSIVYEDAASRCMAAIQIVMLCDVPVHCRQQLALFKWCVMLSLMVWKEAMISAICSCRGANPRPLQLSRRDVS